MNNTNIMDGGRRRKKDNSHELLNINDYTVILNYIKDAPTTMVESYISNGFIHEDMNNSGISHLLEHIVIESWDKCVYKGCLDYWKRKGVIMNASTFNSTIKYFMEGLEKYTMEMIQYIASISSSPQLKKDRMDKEKKAVVNELMIHSANPYTELYDNLNKVMFSNEGLKYQDDIKIQIKNLKSITLEHLKQWTKRFYGQGNVIIIVTGNFSKNKVIKLLKKTLKNTNVSRILPKYSDIFSQGLTIKYIKNKNIINTNIVLSFSSAIYQSDPDIFYIDFFKEFINSGITSMLMDELREKKKLIYNIEIFNHTLAYGTYLTITISTKNKNIENTILNTIKILKRLARGRFTEEYMEYVKKVYMVSYYSMCKNNEYISDFYGEQYINQIYNNKDTIQIRTPNEVFQEILDLKKINLSLFIKKLLVFSNMKIVYQGKREVPNLEKSVLKRI